MREGHETPSLADQFRSFSRAAARDGSPVYEAICAGIAGNDELLDLAGSSPADQRRPNLILAAVHYLLLGGAGDELGRHYDTVCEFRGLGPPSGTEGALVEEFAEFCRARRDELTKLLATRATQTNEIGRCTALLPAFATVAAEHPGRPLALVDLGASAGLNLIFDRYAYDYGGGRRAGEAGSPVHLTCELRGPTVPPLTVAPVAARVGLDRRPLDPADEDGRRWLLGCQWPGHLPRFRRLRDALAVAVAGAGPPPVSAGDMVEDLGSVTAAIPGSAHLCLFHSWVAAYLAPDRQRALSAAVEEVAARRPVSWLFAESPPETPGLLVPPPPVGDAERGATALVLVRAGTGPLDARRLADMHHHGAWLRWWGPRG
ncbi:MAG: DUF2332 domain-containing protein [Acidimicrobiales bacterium]